MPDMKSFLKGQENLEKLSISQKSKLVFWPEATQAVIHSFKIRDTEGLQREL
jgi:hypothetical protein